MTHFLFVAVNKKKVVQWLLLLLHILNGPREGPQARVHMFETMSV